MFNINERPQFTKDVSMALDGQEDDPKNVTVTFDAYSEDELEEFNGGTPTIQKAFLRKVIVTISGIVEDDDKTEIPFSPDILEQVIRWPHARTRFMQAYAVGVTGAKLGN